MTRSIKTVAAAVARQIPTVLVLAALGAAGWWGHRTGWKIPKLAELTHRANAAEAEDWCAEHNVPESRCISCKPELAGASAADWCKEHGVPESRCTICHPEILTKGVAGDWCPEHGLPESNCTICHPEIAVRRPAPPGGNDIQVVADPAPATPATRPAIAADTAHAGRAHGAAAADAPRDPRTCQTHARRIQFASEQSIRKAGVAIAPATQRVMDQAISAYGETQYDRTRYAQIAPRVAGVAWRVDKRAGESVRKGEVLALIDAGEIGKAKAELLRAAALVGVKDKALQRLRAGSASGIRTETELQEAEAALQEARIALFNAQQALVNLGFTLPAGDNAAANLDPQAVRLLGLPESVRSTIDPRSVTANLIPLTAPLDGVVISSDVVAGEIVEPSRPLFTVADPRTLWLMLDVAPADAPRLAVGQPVLFRPEGSRQDAASGRIAWISTAMDDQTRTVKVRAEIDNADGRLLARTFGRARITIRQTPQATVVPSEAIHWEGCCHVVFVRVADEIFQTRKVRLGAEANGLTEIIAGVLPGETVATTGSYVLKSEILKSNLGAGCAGE